MRNLAGRIAALSPPRLELLDRLLTRELPRRAPGDVPPQPAQAPPCRDPDPLGDAEALLASLDELSDAQVDALLVALMNTDEPDASAPTAQPTPSAATAEPSPTTAEPSAATAEPSADDILAQIDHLSDEHVDSLLAELLPLPDIESP